MKRLAALASILTAVSSLTALATATVPVADAAVRRCAPVPTFTPQGSPKALPGGLTMRTWTAPGRTYLGDRARVRVIAVTAHLGPHLAMTPLMSDLTALHPLHLYAERTGVVASVNGDYFAYSPNWETAVPFSDVVVGRAVAKARTTPDPVVGVGTDGTMHAAMMSLTGTVTAGKATFPVAAVNTDGVVGLTLYTSRWGLAERSAGTPEVAVRAGRVIAPRRPGAPVPAGITVLSARHSASATAFLRRLRRGARVSWQVSQRTSTRNLTFVSALGRGPVVLHQGADVADCTRSDTTVSRPRTGIGWADGGRTVIFLTVTDPYGVDGGLTHYQAAGALAHAGATDGVLLDGGASTTLEVRTRLDQAPSRYDAPYLERLIPNGWAFRVH